MALMIESHYTEDFRKQAKHPIKKYRSFPSYLAELQQQLLENPTLGGKTLFGIR